MLQIFKISQFEFGIVLLLSCISGCIYRAGGIGNNPKYNWLPRWARNTKVRDLGCPLVMLAAMWILGLWNWWLLLSFLLMFGALTTYWDELFKFDNHWFHGFMVGAAMFPYAWATNNWFGLGLYSILLAIAMGAWSRSIKWDDLEEFGRGFFIIPFLLVFLVSI